MECLRLPSGDKPCFYVFRSCTSVWRSCLSRPGTSRMSRRIPATGKPKAWCSASRNMTRRWRPGRRPEGGPDVTQTDRRWIEWYARWPIWVFAERFARFAEENRQDPRRSRCDPESRRIREDGTGSGQGGVLADPASGRPSGSRPSRGRAGRQVADLALAPRPARTRRPTTLPCWIMAGIVRIAAGPAWRIRAMPRVPCQFRREALVRSSRGLETRSCGLHGVPEGSV